MRCNAVISNYLHSYFASYTLRYIVLNAASRFFPQKRQLLSASSSKALTDYLFNNCINWNLTAVFAYLEKC